MYKNIIKRKIIQILNNKINYIKNDKITKSLYSENEIELIISGIRIAIILIKKI